MVRKRIKSKSTKLGKEKQEKMTFIRALEIAKACDNIPPSIEDFVKDE